MFFEGHDLDQQFIGRQARAHIFQPCRPRGISETGNVAAQGCFQRVAAQIQVVQPGEGLAA